MSGGDAPERDVVWMRRALQLGRNGLGRTSPNPPVGAIVVRDGRVVGEGWHRRAGTAHAEVVALEHAGARAHGATLYCTLEPCSHVGRTPACVPRIVAAGIARLVVGAPDPNPRVRGRGLKSLRRAGLEVAAGVEAERCRELVRFFARHVTSGLPFVRLKLAASADGRIATRSRRSRWISGPAARQLVHSWRNELDAVLVGVGTVLADDPALTCRMAGGRDPVRVVVDSRLRTPLTARLLREGRGPAWIATTPGHDPRRAERLVAAGASIIAVPGRGGRVELGRLFRALGERGIVSVLAEGGAELAAALLRGGHVDELCWFAAPLLLGGDGVPMVGSLGIKSMNEALKLRVRSVEPVGRDWLHVATPIGRRTARLRGAAGRA